MKSRKLLNPFYLSIISCMLLAACRPMDAFEKTVAIPGYEWQGSFKPAIDFDVTDTAAPYSMYIVLRHQNAYEFNNIWLRLSLQQPGDTAVKSHQYDLKLANDETGWLGTGMDDIFEHRILIQDRAKFERPGKYRFTIEQVMRQDPLLHVMNVGLRIEKTP
ncbi:MAG TPA: gliding motility lipoprotein GldH [Chitinophagaceae bacterium]|nr:gliding motility lipoprotein GldH [Chitinophagaceae bacterium]